MADLHEVGLLVVDIAISEDSLEETGIFVGDCNVIGRGELTCGGIVVEFKIAGMGSFTRVGDRVFHDGSSFTVDNDVGRLDGKP